MKRCSAILVIREIQIKKAMKYTIKLEKKQLTKSNAGEDMEQQECEYTLGKFKWMPPLCKTVRHHLLKRNIFHGTAIPLLDP